MLCHAMRCYYDMLWDVMLCDGIALEKLVSACMCTTEPLAYLPY